MADGPGLVTCTTPGLAPGQPCLDAGGSPAVFSGSQCGPGQSVYQIQGVSVCFTVDQAASYFGYEGAQLAQQPSSPTPWGTIALVAGGLLVVGLLLK